jgi:hypothetical protein
MNNFPTKAAIAVLTIAACYSGSMPLLIFSLVVLLML